MKTLVILIGNSRGTDVAWKSLLNHVLDPLEADLALVFGSNEKTNILYERAKYIKLVDEYDDWGTAIDYIMDQSNIQPFDWKSTLIRDKTNGLWGGILFDNNKLAGSGAIIFILRYFVIQLINEHNLLDKYDRFIVSRSDHYYMFTDYLNYDNNLIWIPKGEDYGGITDRHIICSKKHIIDILNIFPWILHNRICTGDNPESTLKHYFKSINKLNLIKRFDRNMFTIRSDTDQTRWGRNGIYLPDLGVYTKYTQEYHATIKNHGNKMI